MIDPDIILLINHIAKVIRDEGYMIGNAFKNEFRLINTDCFSVDISKFYLGWKIDISVCNNVLATKVERSLKKLTFEQAIELNIRVGDNTTISPLTLNLPRSSSMLTITTNLSDYQKELQDRNGAIFGVCLVQDKNIALSPGACEFMGVDKYELLNRDLRFYWLKKDIEYNPTIVSTKQRPKTLKEFIKTLKQQSYLENHSYPGWKNDIWGTWTANIKVREIAPFHFVREHEALEFIPASWYII